MTNIETLQRLDQFNPVSDSFEELEEITEKLSELENPKDALVPVLRFIERHPSADLGAPGPLVHFVEQFFRQGYEQELILSVLRAPTTLSVWMLNRVINGVSGEEKRRYLSIMSEIAKTAQSEEVRVIASDFFSGANG